MLCGSRQSTHLEPVHETCCQELQHLATYTGYIRTTRANFCHWMHRCMMSEITETDMFYIANASPYDIRVRQGATITENVHEANVPEPKEITISPNEYVDFAWHFIDVADQRGHVFYSSSRLANKSLIVRYRSSTLGRYSSTNFSVYVSDDVNKGDQTAVGEAVWVRKDGEKICRVREEDVITLNEFRVANCLPQTISVKCFIEGKPNLTDVAYAECTNVSFRCNEVVICVKDTGTEILKGEPTEFSSRAIIVTSQSTVRRSVLLNTNMGDISNRSWVAEDDQENHYPKWFYVANGSPSSLRVNALLREFTYPAESAGSEELLVFTSLRSNEYRKFQGVHVRIRTEDNEEICNTEIEEKVSVIIRSPMVNDYVFSQAVSKPVADTTNIWKGSDGYNYDPNGSFYVANASDFPVYVNAFVASNSHNQRANYNTHQTVESHAYRMFHHCSVVIWNQAGQILEESGDVNNISLIITGQENGCVRSQEIDTGNIAHCVWICGDVNYNPLFFKTFYVANASKVALHVKASTSRTTDDSTGNILTYPLVPSGAYTKFSGCQAKIWSAGGTVICSRLVDENKAIIVKSHRPNDYVLSCRVSSADEEEIWKTDDGRCHKPTKGCALM